MNVKFKNQLLITMTISIVVCLLSCVFLARSTFRSTFLDSKKHLLKSESLYIESSLIQNGIVASTLDDYSKNHNVRVTVIDSEGVPLYDSMVDFHEMENHYYRPEIKGARKGVTSTSVRISNTTLFKTLYSATYFPKTQRYIRTSSNINELNEWDIHFLTKLIPIVFILFIIIFGSSLILIGYITKPVKQLIIAANKYGKGDFSKRTAIDKPYEFARLSLVMNQMANDIEEQLNLLTDDRNTYSSILSAMVEGVLVTDGERRITLCNHAAVDMFGLDVTRPISLMSLFSDISFDELVKSAINKNEPSRYILSRFGCLSGETAQIVGKGKHRTYQVIIAPILQNDNSKGSVITFNDISEIKHLEQVRKDFVSNVSHELKTPLTSIAGFASILVQENLNVDESKKYAKIIEKNTLQMKEVIEDLLILASLEKENAQINLELGNISAIIQEAISICNYKAQIKEIKIEFENKKDYYIYCSYSLLRQAISNLLLNAISYSKENKVISIEICEDESNIRINIKDEGYGISFNDQTRIFERFYRVDKARSKKSGGTGLGLSIVRHIMDIHKGNVTVESRLGIGSTFSLVFNKRESNDNNVDCTIDDINN